MIAGRPTVSDAAASSQVVQWSSWAKELELFVSSVCCYYSCETWSPVVAHLQIVFVNVVAARLNLALRVLRVLYAWLDSPHHVSTSNECSHLGLKHEGARLLWGCLNACEKFQRANLKGSRGEVQLRQNKHVAEQERKCPTLSKEYS